jgi:hypothetical protein
MLLPEKGERTLSVGQTGSGKTAFNTWMLQRMPNSPIVIYDTKDEPKFESLPDSTTVHTFNGIHNAIDEGQHDYVVFRTPTVLLDKGAELDKYLFRHFLELPGIDAYIDEVSDFHSGSGQAFVGLRALLRKGRSRGNTTLMSTQRPVFLSRFALTEAQQLYIFHLSHDDDRKALDKVVPGFKDKLNPRPKSYRFWHYNAGEDLLQYMNKVPLDTAMPQTYTDEERASTAESDADKLRRLVWV